MTAAAQRPPADPADDRAGIDQVRQFAFLQGLGKNLLAPQGFIDDDSPTTTALPPRAARGGTGRALPSGTCELLDVAFPGGRVAPDADLVGHLLVAALGLQRRELDQPYADHRAVASGRARFPVHALLVDAGSVRYLDHYRHALVDVAVDCAERPRPGTARIVLAARYSDLPAAYQRTRASVAEAELGIALRAITELAQLFGVGVRSVVAGGEVAGAAGLVGACGPGVWSAPVVVELALPDGHRDPIRSLPLPGGGLPPDPAVLAEGDALLARSSADLTTRQAARVSATRLDLPDAVVATTVPRARPADRPASPSWARVLAARSAGNAPGRRNGFSLRPTTLDAGVLADLAGWVAVPAPVPPGVAEHVTVRVAVQRAADHEAGLYRLVGGRLVLERSDPRLVRTLGARYGQHSSADTEIGLRHACAVWQVSADLEAVLDRVGPAGWPLIQLYCGWLLHGLSLAAAAHGLINRPTRSYDEHTIAQTLRLDRKDIPMFMSVCGRPAYVPPALDLRP